MNIFLEIAASSFAHTRGGQLALFVTGGIVGSQAANDSSPQAVAGKEIRQF
jgi:hypothetical protein